jgi:hypothetical protein
MDRKQIDDEHIVARYLADQLSPAEADAFEAYYIEHPSMVREIEQALRLREGLATLRDRQQLDGLMRARRWRWALPLSIAAAVMIAVAGLLAWQGDRQVSPAVAATLQDLMGEAKSPLPLGGKYLLVRMRDAGQALEISLPEERSALELQMLPASGIEGAPYQADVERVGTDGRPALLGRIHGLTPGPDGLVSAVIDSAKLQPGRYVVQLAPARVDETTPTERFAIDIR